VKLIPGYKGLGISLTPNGVINAIEPNSPSDKAGLRKDYRIVEVNSIDVRDKSNKEIAKLIKEHENKLVIGVYKTPQDQARDQAPTVIAERPQATDVLIGSQIASEISRPKTPQPFDGNQSVSSASGKKISGMLRFYSFLFAHSEMSCSFFCDRRVNAASCFFFFVEVFL
jgi:hypothetical protein